MAAHEKQVRRRLRILAAAAALAAVLTAMHAARSQEGDAPPPKNQTFVRLTNNANAVIAEPAAMDPAKGRIVFLTVHP